MSATGNLPAGIARHRSMFDLSGRTAIVTGAGRGIGRAIAEALGAWGARIVVAELDEQSARDAAEHLRSGGVDAIALPTDVTNTESVERLFDEAASRFGGVDVLVNNAGISARIPAEAYPDADLIRMTELNLYGVYKCMRAAAARWIAAKRGGKIINLASFAGVVADPMSAPYAATKGAVVQLTRTCAVEWAPHGILVNAIGPGYVRTEMTSRTLDQPETGASVRARTPLGRAATTDEIAGAAVYLAARASDYVTGHILMVDGGWTAV